MDITTFIQKLTDSGFQGDTDTSPETREKFSHDASLFELMPQLVVAPKDTADVERLVQTVNDCRSTMPGLSLTPRSAGTDMAGGAVGDSISIDFMKHMNTIESVEAEAATGQPGVFYRDFEKATLEKGAIMPSYPASRDLCALGGIVANNSGGEKSLQFGKVEKFVNQLQVVFTDGKQYTVRPLNRQELDAKMAQGDFEGNLYKQVFELIEANYDVIKAAKPNVSKNSMGYGLWNVWDRETGVFDLCQLIIGSEGTLGLVTDITFRLVPHQEHSGTLVMFLRSTDDLGKLINDVLEHKPATFEGFDNHTLILSFKLFLYFHKHLGWPTTIKLAFQLLPDALLLFRGIPKMVLLAEFNADTPEDVSAKVHALRVALKQKGYDHEMLYEEDDSEAKSRKFWIMRRESFALLRQKVKDKHTAPFIDDFVVNPEHLPEFLPELRAVIKKYKLLATIAGHMGDGNFHVIPLMKIEQASERAKLQPAMKEVNELVLKYHGSLSGEHNDGMIRGPWLQQMYGPEVLALFKQVKTIFDAANILNPHKKTDATWEFSMAHIREHF